MLTAFIPRGPRSSSKVTKFPSDSSVETDEIWKKYFTADSISLMNPYPLSALKYATCPF